MLKEVEGFILTEVKYGDTSKIINIFTKEYGLIGVIAKGAYSLKSKLRSSTSKLTYAKFQIYYKEDKLSLLKEVDIIDSLKNIKGDLLKVSYLTYMSELTHQVIKQTNNMHAYELFINTILKLEKGIDPMSLVNILETKYLTFLGVELNLEECCKCGNENNLECIDGSNGGLICINCKEQITSGNERSIKLLKIYKDIDIKKIKNLNLDDSLKREVDMFLKMYYENYTGLYLKSKKFLENIEKL